jgi:hypothetical protein
MAKVIGPHAQAFIDGLNSKPVTSEYAVFTVAPGNKYDKIIAQPHNSSQKHVYAFVDIDGNVYKAAGWQAPAKGIRFASVASALVMADPYGSFLYIR